MNSPKLETNSDKIRKSIISEFKKQKLKSKKESNETTLGDLLDEKVIGFVFDASWCTPGKKFRNDLLTPIYNDSIRENLNFEVVLVLFDTDEEQVRDEMMNEHPNWFLWPLDKPITKYLPSLVIITSNFQIISSVGRKELNQNGIDAIISWSYFWKQAKNVN